MASRPSSTTSALSVVELAIAILEDEDCLNAGYGSNLTFEGAVECDAAIMDGQTGDFGSVGAVSGTFFSFTFSCDLVEHGRLDDLITPSLLILPTLVASGARAFAQTHGIETVETARMIAPRATQDWQRWMRRYNEGVSSTTAERHTDSSEGLSQDAEHMMEDTVGAISMGLARESGSLGYQAGMTSWLINSRPRRLARGVGRSNRGTDVRGWLAVYQVWITTTDLDSSITRRRCSGAGEYIVRTGLARTIADVLRPGSDGEGGTESLLDVHELLVETLSNRFHGELWTNQAPLIDLRTEYEIRSRLAVMLIPMLVSY
ncbi:nucleophile aminohydrolase [Chiua virens]|nr:nucleophile aminohydrolase [Chiua virens]